MSEKDKVFDILDPFSTLDLGIADWADGIKTWAADNRELIQPVKLAINDFIMWVEGILHTTPPVIMIVIISLIAWQIAGRRSAVVVLACLVAIGMLDPTAWNLAMTTLTIILCSVTICIVIGLPLGVLTAKSRRLEALLRPVLDTMQTIPAFVYLVPVVMLIGIGNVSGVLVTIVFALPPLIRLTALGLRQVDGNVVEAARAFGANPAQILFKVEFPLAMPSIMAGINQTIMLAISMVVIASMIAVKGLGTEVLRAMGRLDAGKAIVGGLGIVLLAVVLDRITQGVGQSGRERGRHHWWQGGPIGIVTRLMGRTPDALKSPAAAHDPAATG